MKICFFPHYSFSNRDGATLSMYNIIDELLERGHEVVVVLPNKNHLEERLRDKRIDFLHIPMYSMRMTIDKITAASNFKFFMKYCHNNRMIGKICRELKDRKVDCIHINGLDSSVGAKVAVKLNIPYVWHIRAFIEEDLGKRLFFQKETYDFVKKADSVIGISKDIKKKFEKELGREVTVVYNGIPQKKYDIPNHEILENETVKMLLAGRISIQKGQMTAVKAVEILKNEGIDNLVLTLVGQGETKEYMEELKQYIVQHLISDNIVIKEHTDDLSELRKQCDIGLTCSQREAFGRVSVENMMAGLLVIGSDSGGTSEIVDDQINGYLFAVDDPKSLAEVIKNVLNDRNKAKMIAHKGYVKSLEEFTIKRVVDEVVEIYISCMKIEN